MKVLISCYACSPYRGSEPGMGWKFVRELAKEHELHVITEAVKWRGDIERYRSEHPGELVNVHFHYIAKVRHRLLRKIWPPSYYWFYREWQKQAYALAQQLEAVEHFDVVHQLNMVGYREPGYLWKLGKPCVWGPIGGFNHVPWCMIPSMGFRGGLYHVCYNIINAWQMRTSLLVREAMRRADVLIGATEEVVRAISKHYHRESVLIPEVGLEGESPFAPALRGKAEPLRLCWSGQHTPGKSLNLLLESLALLRREDIELHVIGAGERTAAWKKLCARLCVKNVIWHGWVERAEALQLMQKCHAFCITSLKDLTSTVILEALSFGMPVIALNHCGFSNILTPTCGRKIDIRSHPQVIRDFADAIAELADNEPLRRELAEGARERAQEYNWEAKGKTVSGLYNNIAER